MGGGEEATAFDAGSGSASSIKQEAVRNVRLSGGDAPHMSQRP